MRETAQIRQLSHTRTASTQKSLEPRPLSVSVDEDEALAAAFDS
jgi:hypothetical protein